MGEGPFDTLRLIEKATLVLYTAFALGSLVFRDRNIFLGVLAGGAFVLLNFRLLRLISQMVFRDPENPRPGFFFLLVPKFTLVGVALWLCVKYQWFDMVAFTVGTLCLFLAIVGVTLFRGAPRARGPDAPAGERNGKDEAVP